MTAVAQSKNSVTLNVEAVALVKIGSTSDLVRAAAERFAGQDNAVEQFTQDQLEGALRGIIAQQDVVDLMQNRQAFAEQIAQNIAPELKSQGLVLDSFQIKGITDSDGYIQSLGAPEIEARRREAEIARAAAEREIQKKNTAVEEQNLTEFRALEINKAEAERDVKTAQAEAQQAESLIRAEREQQVLQQQAKNERDRLDSTVNAQADADKYKRNAAAEAQANERVKAAEAEAAEKQRQAEADAAVAEAKAKAQRTRAEADAHAERMRAEADAHAQRVKAEAEAAGIAAKAKAEADAEREIGTARAEALEAEAKAMEKNQQAILASKITEIMPELVRDSPKALSSINGVTIYGGSDATDTVSSINSQPMSNVAGVLSQTENLFGIKISDILTGRVTGAAAGSAIGEALAEKRDSTPVSKDSSED